jgi:hypothetical protein
MNCREQLSNDVKKLLLTLGQRPLVSKTIAKGFGLVVDAFPVSFRPVDINPFLLPVKRDKVDPKWGSGNSFRRLVTSIEEVEPQLTQCISVDSFDHTYLCTENMVPTHNTGKRINWATGAVKEQKDLEKDTQLLLYYYALKNMFPDREYYVSIYYINDSKIDGVDVKGGLFDICFDESDYIKAEGILRAKFEEIRDTQRPKLLSENNSHWKCKYLCKFSEQYKDTDKTVCQHIRDEVKGKGINQVVAEYGKGLDHISRYGSGGGVLSDEDKASDST